MSDAQPVPAIQPTSAQLKAEPSTPGAGPRAPKRPSAAARVAAWFARLGRGMVRGFGPGAILDKELRIQGRRVGTYWVRFGFGLLMAAFVGLTLSNVLARAGVSEGASLNTIEQFQRSGPVMLISVAWMLFFGMSFAAAIFTSPLVCEERRAGTLATLLTTPLTAWQIVVGKMCGALVQLLILGLIGLPVLLAVRVFGGISGEMVLAAIAIISGATIGACALGILASTLSPRQSSAIAASIVFTIMWFVAPPLAGLVLSRLLVIVPWGELFTLSPGASLVVLSSQLESTPVVAPTPIPFWIINFAVSLGVAAIALLVATLRLRSLMRQVATGRESTAHAAIPQDAPDAAPDSVDPSLSPRERRKARRLADKRARAAKRAIARSGSRTVGDHPVLWREIRQPVTTRRWIAWSSGIGITLLIAYAFYASSEGEIVAMVISMVGLVTSVLIVCGTAGSAMGQERESRSWETLLTTPLSAGQIITGKLVGVLVRLRFIWSFLFATVIVACIGWDVRPALLIHLALIVGSATFFAASLGFLFGTITRRSMVAIVASMGSVLGLWMVVPIMAGMCTAMALGGAEELMSVIAMTNPAAMLAVALEGAVDGSRGATYDLFGRASVSTFEFTFAVSIFAGVYFGLGLALLAVARSALAHATLRSSSHFGPTNASVITG